MMGRACSFNDHHDGASGPLVRGHSLRPSYHSGLDRAHDAGLRLFRPDSDFLVPRDIFGRSNWTTEGSTSIQSSLPSLRRSSPFQRALLGRKRSFICASGSEDAESGSSPPLGGDKHRQEVLAQIAMLQAQKVRITDFLDERSAYLTKFAKDADSEFDLIGQNAMKELDAVGDQILERLDSKMQAFEETAEVQRQEIEMNDKVLEDFEDWIEKEKNEGMFFKSLGKVKPRNKKEIKLGLMAILGLTIANAVFATPEVEWRKVAALALIFIGLVAQVIYEQDISPPKALITKV